MSYCDVISYGLLFMLIRVVYKNLNVHCLQYLNNYCLQYLNGNCLPSRSEIKCFEVFVKKILMPSFTFRNGKNRFFFTYNIFKQSNVPANQNTQLKTQDHLIIPSHPWRIQSEICFLYPLPSHACKPSKYFSLLPAVLSRATFLRTHFPLVSRAQHTPQLTDPNETASFCYFVQLPGFYYIITSSFFNSQET